MFKKNFRLTSIILAASIVFTSVIGNDAICVKAATPETVIEVVEDANSKAEEIKEEAEENSEEIIEEEESIEEVYVESESAKEDIVYIEGVVDAEFVPAEEELTQFGHKPSDFTAPESANAQNEDGIESIIPEKYDSRTETGYVSPVRDQTVYGTCWTFATMGSIEAGMMSNGYAVKEDALNYSERHLAWLFYNLDGVNDPLGNTEGDYNVILAGDRETKEEYHSYDMGGNSFESTIVLSKWIGAVDENAKDEYKYPVANSNNSKDVAKESRITLDTDTVYDSQVHLQNVRHFSLSQPEEIKKAIMKYGTLYFSYGHYFEDENYNFTTNGADGSVSYYCPFIARANHDVTIVGWDDDYSRDKFDSYCINNENEIIHYKPQDNGAWLIRNSWGANSLEEGYMWISYEDGSIGNTPTAFDAEPADNYDNNYFYDGGNADVWSENETKSVANVFTAKGNPDGNEELQAVGIYLASSDVDYSIQIYKLTDEQLKSGVPTSGTPLLEEPQTGKTTFSGYYTIPLEQTVILSEGEIFAVVFSSNQAFSTFIDISTDWPTYDRDGETLLYTEIHHSEMKEGQSFAILDGENKWKDGKYLKEDEDATEGITYRVHAYTDNVSEDVTPTSPASAPTSILFSNVTYDEGAPKAINLETDEYYDIRTKVIGDGSFEKGVIWSSSNPDVATVDSTGHIVAVSDGKTTITASSKANETVKCSVDVYVLGDLSVSVPDPYSDNGEKIEHTLYYDFWDISKKSMKVNCSYGNAGYTPGYIEWSSSNSKVAEFKDSSKGELTINNPGYTEIQVTVDNHTSEKYAITVLPTMTDTDQAQLNYTLKFSGEIGLSWLWLEMFESYKVVDQSRKIHYSCNQSDDKSGNSCSLTNYVGKTVPNSGLTFNVIGTYKFYQTESNYINKEFTCGSVSLSADKFNNRGITLELYGTYPDGTREAFSILSKILYKDNASMVSPTSLKDGNGDSVFNDKDKLKGYEFEKWIDKTNPSISVNSGETVNTFFADYVIFDFEQENNEINNYNVYGFKPAWSHLKVDEVRSTNGFDSTGEFTETPVTVKSKTKVILECSTPGAKIKYCVTGDKNTNPSTAEYRDYTGPIVLTYEKENPEDPDSEVVYIFAKATKDGYSDSDIYKAGGYKIMAEGCDWGYIPQTDYESVNFPYTDPSSIPKGIWAYGYDNLPTYTGQAITFPNLKVFYYKTPLVLGTDYTIRYSNNTNSNTEYSGNGYKTDGLSSRTINSLPCITITGKGSFSGTKKIYFGIAQQNIDYSCVTITNNGVLTFNNGRGKINPVIQFNSPAIAKPVILKLNKDYRVDFSNGSDSEHINNPSLDYKTKGVYTVKVTGVGNFTGETTYTIDVRDKTNTIFMSSASVGRLANVQYSGSPVTIPSDNFVVKSGMKPLVITTKPEPEETTVAGNYYVKYEEGADYTNIGTKTITLVGTEKEYNGITVIGEKTVTFNVVGRQMRNVTVTGIPKSVEYSGYARTVSDDEFSNIVLTFKDIRTPSVTLEKGVDYDITYEKNTDAGTATIIFTGKGLYTGTIRKTFKITSVDLLAAGNEIVFDNPIDPTEELPHFYYYIKGSKPSISVKYTVDAGMVTEREIELTEGKDYTVRYQNNTAVNDGVTPIRKPTVVVTGKGNYKGTLTSVFAINKRDLSDNIAITSTDTFDGKYNSTIALYDKNVNNTKLSAGTDYDNNIVYTYVNATDVKVRSGITYRDEARSKGAVIRKGDIIPDNTLIRATVTGKNNYEGSISTIFRTCRYNISRASVKFNNDAYSYNGSPVEPDINDITLTYRIGRETRILNANDFEILGYSNNNHAGYGLVTVRGKGDFGGTTTIRFKINASKFVN